MTRSFYHLAAIGGMACVCTLLSGCERPVPVPPEPIPTPEPIATPVPAPTPTLPPYVPNKRLDVGKIFNGMQIRTSLETEQGGTATAVRAEPSSYGVEVKVKVTIPRPHQDLAELAKLNPQLPVILPWLGALLETAKVSPSYDELYRLKTAALQRSLMRLDGMLSRHNFFDCETLLELQAPATQRRALLIQCDMDTDSDGSDSDRVPEVDGSSATFQPFTSYKWGKKTANVNSFIVPRQARLRQAEQELATPGLAAGRAQQLRTQQQSMKVEIADLQKYSFLVGAADPYVVLPGSMFGKKFGAFAPKVGDYCVVIYGDELFPAVVGDVGPSNLVGEASLRICRQISSRADANNRAVSDLKVTYLVFPGTAHRPLEAPDLDKWRTTCEQLLTEMGGYNGTLFQWEDLTKPKPPVLPPALPIPPGILPPATPAPAPVATPPPAAPPSASTPPPQAPSATPPPPSVPAAG